MKLNSRGKLFLAFLFLLVAYWQVSFMQFSMKFDMMDWFFPMRYLVGECLQNNILPTWNPFTNLGYPLHTDPQSGALYPPVWLLGGLFGYSVYTLHLEFILHILLAFYGMKKLCTEVGMNTNIALIVGISYACCGFFVGNAQHLSWIISATWIPFSLYYYIRLMRFNNWRDAIGLSTVSYLLLSGGYPAFIITLFYLLGIAFLFRMAFLLKMKSYKIAKTFLWNNCIFVLVFLMQSLTFLKFFLESLPFLVRADSLTLKEVQLLPFTPPSFLSMILPLITGGDSAFFKTDISMSNAYFGLFGFLLLVVYLLKKPDWKGLIIWVCGIFFLLVAMGDYFWLRGLLYEYVPMMNMFRYPSLFRVFAILSFLLLFGFSLQGFQQKTVQGKDWKKLRIVGISLLVLLIGIFIFAIQKSDFQLPDQWTGASIVDFLNKNGNSQMVLIQAPVQIILLSLLLFKSFYKKGISFIKFAAILILIDLFLSVQFNTFLTITSEANLSSLHQKIDQLPETFPIPKENLSEVSHMGGSDYYPIWYNQNILKKKIAHNGYNNFVFKDYRTFSRRAEVQKILDNPILYISGNSGLDSMSNVNDGKVIITDFAPNRLVATVKLPEATELTFLQYYYPGWKVKIDGQEVSAFKKEDIFLAVNVPEGEHEIVFSFYPEHFKIYLLISFGTFILILIFGLKRKIETLRLKTIN